MKLEDLRVKSFVTSFDRTENETKKINGGKEAASWGMCYSHNIPCQTDDAICNSGADYCDYEPTEYTPSGCNHCYE